MARPKESENSKKASNGKTKNGNGPLAGVKDFRYEAPKRKNIPPAKIAAEGVVLHDDRPRRLGARPNLW